MVKHRVRWRDGVILIGEKEEHRGHESYPHFILEDGRRIGVHEKDDLGPVEETVEEFIKGELDKEYKTRLNDYTGPLK